MRDFWLEQHFCNLIKHEQPITITITAYLNPYRF